MLQRMIKEVVSNFEKACNLGRRAIILSDRSVVLEERARLILAKAKVLKDRSIIMKEKAEKLIDDDDDDNGLTIKKVYRFRKKDNGASFETIFSSFKDGRDIDLGFALKKMDLVNIDSWEDYRTNKPGYYERPG